MGRGRREKPALARERGEPAGPSRRVTLLWGPGERGVRGPKPTLSVEEIVGVAIDLADRSGIDAVSMRRIADELGFTTMALYRHVPGKDELIDLMVDQAIGLPPSPPGDAPGDWASQLELWARSELALFQRHPWLLELVARTPLGPNWFAWLERAVGALSETRLTGKEKLAMASLVDGHVRGAAQIFLGIARAERTDGQDAWAAAFGAALERVVAEGRFPALASVVAEGSFVPGDAPADDHFEFGLHRLLDGIGTCVREREAQSSPRKSASRRRR